MDDVSISLSMLLLPRVTGTCTVVAFAEAEAASAANPTAASGWLTFLIYQSLSNVGLPFRPPHSDPIRNECHDMAFTL